MKKIVIGFLLAGAFGLCFAQNLKGGVSEAEFVDYMQAVNLTEAQKKEVLKIQNEERNVLRPYSLELSAKENGLKYLEGLKCPRFDLDCKRLLKEDIEKVEFEKNEVIRKINQKKSYYNIRYRNLLTREQDIKIQQMVKDNEHKNKVLKEREIRQKREERIEKLKFWNNFKK